MGYLAGYNQGFFLIGVQQPSINPSGLIENSIYTTPHSGDGFDLAAYFF